MGAELGGRPGLSDGEQNKRQKDAEELNKNEEISYLITNPIQLIDDGNLSSSAENIISGFKDQVGSDDIATKINQSFDSFIKRGGGIKEITSLLESNDKGQIGYLFSRSMIEIGINKPNFGFPPVENRTPMKKGELMYFLGAIFAYKIKGLQKEN